MAALHVGLITSHCLGKWPQESSENILPTLHDETNDDGKEDLLIPSPCENQQYQDKKLSSKYY